MLRLKRFSERERLRQTRDASYSSKTPYASIRQADYQVDRIQAFIQQDKDIIALIREVLAEIKQDSKLETLKQLLSGGLKGSKVLIFSYFATTIEYLRQQLDDSFLAELGLQRDQVAFLKSKNGEYKQGICAAFFRQWLKSRRLTARLMANRN